MSASEDARAAARLAWESQVSAGLRANHPGVFEYVEDDPDLPRVMLIGDSISIGYTLTVRRRLDGVANVHFTEEGYALLGEWAAESILEALGR